MFQHTHTQGTDILEEEVTDTKKKFFFFFTPTNTIRLLHVFKVSDTQEIPPNNPTEAIIDSCNIIVTVVKTEFSLQTEQRPVSKNFLNDNNDRLPKTWAMV